MMNDRQFEKKIKQALRNDSEGAFLSEKNCEARRVAFLKQIGVENTARPAYTWREYAQYYTWNFTHGILLPAAAGFAMVLFVIGGWMTTAAAASEALPGDPLYGFKISTEKLQISLTFNASKRADLQLSFASRRLSEMAALNAMQSDDKAERVQVAVNGFKSQVNGVTSTLQGLSEQKDQASVARAVDQATQVYKEVIAAQDEETAASVETEVDTASDAAVEVIMSNAEENTEDTQAADEARASFALKKDALDTRVKLMLGRIAVLREAGASAELDAQTESLMALATDLADAEALLETGAYRTAFAQLTEVEIALEEIEATTAEETKGTEESEGTNDTEPVSDTQEGLE